MNTQDFKINGNYFIDLDSYVDLAGIQSLEPEIIRGIVLSKQYIEPLELGKKDALYDSAFVEPQLYIKENFVNTPEFNDLISRGFSLRQIYDYSLFRFPVTELGNKLLLRTYKGYSINFGRKSSAELNEDQPCYSHFPGLKKWIEDSNIFSEVGRIIIFVNSKGSCTPVHCDYQNLESRKDQFIWINLSKRKPFFILDSDFQKQYVTGQINTFDNATWHGSDPVNHACFTMRIDGHFSREFLNKTGLYEHFNQNS